MPFYLESWKENYFNERIRNENGRLHPVHKTPMTQKPSNKNDKNLNQFKTLKKDGETIPNYYFAL